MGERGRAPKEKARIGASKKMFTRVARNQDVLCAITPRESKIDRVPITEENRESGTKRHFART